MKRRTMFFSTLVFAFGFFLSTTAWAQTSLLGDTQISFEKAMEIATQRVGGGVVKEIEWENKYGRLGYEVKVYHGGMKHEVKVDASTGEVRNLKSKRSKHSQLPNGLSAQQVNSQKSIELAAVALQRVGGGTLKEISWEFKHGQLVFEVEINHEGRRHKAKVDVATGEVVIIKSK